MMLRPIIGTLSILITMNMLVNAESLAELNPKKELLSELERELLNELCPAVDICDANATTAKLRSNGVVWKNKISCCKGCSCHEECSEMPNCCFPDQENRTDDAPSPIYECQPTRTGAQNPDVQVSAYWTVVRAPQSGCLDNEPVKIRPGLVVYPTCDDDDDDDDDDHDDKLPLILASTPVYSTNTDKIYKNFLCARCHGVTQVTPFKALLGFKRQVSLAEQMAVFETGKLPRNSFLDFIYSDAAVISSKRCFVDVIKTCEVNEMNDITTDIDFDGVGFDMVKAMCETGVYSPISAAPGITYRNVFCAICGSEGHRRKHCDPEVDSRTISKSLMYFLDSSKLIATVPASHSTDVPKVCLTSNIPQIDERCRQTYCSSGQLRQINGGCAFVSKSMVGGKGVVHLKLTPTGSKDSILNTHVNIDANLMKDALSGKPWSQKWQIIKVYKRLDEAQCAEKGEFIVDIIRESARLDEQYNDLKTSIIKPWVMEINGSRFRYHQSFQEYTIDYTPFWKKDQSNFNRTDRYFDCEAINWSWVYRHAFATITVQLNKLFLCQQIELRPGEFTLGLGNAYLESNLTSRVLYDKEFDLIMNEEYHARVCVHDTIFSREASNAGPMPTSRIFTLAVALGALRVLLKS